MKIGDVVALTKEVSYPAKDDYDQPYTAALAKGTKGIVANIVDVRAGDYEELIIYFNPIDTENIYAVSKDSVKKSK